MTRLPPCPNPSCKPYAHAVIRHGFSSPLKVLGGQRRSRYRCTGCHKTFSQSTYSLQFSLKNVDPGLNQKIFSQHVHGLSNRSIARLQRVSEHCVRRRLKRMSQWAFDYHSKKLSELLIAEPICMDGLQNFAGSQYDPNYVNQAVGQGSLFIYDFNLCPMNRSGKMSVWQKNRLQDLERHEGCYHSSTVRTATTKLLLRLQSRLAPNTGPLRLLSDEHFQYRRSVVHDLRHLKIDHITISSKCCRNFQNILFPVNHSDLLIRQRIAAFARETISFSKTLARMAQRFILFSLHKNYMVPQFTKKHLRRPLAHQKSPAELLNLESKILEFGEIFSIENRILTRGEAIKHEEWKYFSTDRTPKYCHRNKKHLKNQKLQITTSLGAQ